MSISDKITSIENHLSADYEGLENIGADLTNINKNIENIRPVLDTIYSNLPKVSNEGTEVTLTPTLKGKLQITPKGNSTQEGTPTPSSRIPIKSVTGNNNVVVRTLNLFNKDDIMEGKAVISTGAFVNKDNYNCSNYIEVKPNTTYTLKPCVSHSTYQTLCQYDSSKNFVVYTYVRAETITFTTEANTKYIVFNFVVGNQDTVQLVEGSSVPTEYVPYGNQTLPLNLRSTNWFNGILEVGTINNTTGVDAYSTNVLRTKNYIEVLPNTQYTISNNKDYANYVYEYDSNNTFIKAYTGSDYYHTYSFTTSATTKYIRIRTISDQTDTTVKHMLNLGNTALTYEDYWKIDLNGISTYKDLIFKAVNGNSFYDSLTSEQKALLSYGNWYKKDVIRELTYDGTNLIFSLASTRTNTILFQTPLSVIVDVGNVSALDVLDNMFINQSVYGNDVAGIQHTRQTLYLSVNKTDLASYDVTGLNTLIKDKMTMLFPRATQVYTSITDGTLISQLENIDKVKGYNGTTIITSTYEDGNAQMIIEGSALKGE